GPAPSAGGGHAPETSVGLERAPETSASAWASIPALDFLARPEGSYRALASLGVETPLPPAWADCLEVRVRSRGYIERQRRAAGRAGGDFARRSGGNAARRSGGDFARRSGGDPARRSGGDFVRRDRTGRDRPSAPDRTRGRDRTSANRGDGRNRDAGRDRSAG